MSVYISDDTSNWGTAVLTGWNPASGEGWRTSTTFTQKTGRYVRLLEVDCTGGSDNPDNHRMYEFQAYVTPSPNYQLDLEVQFTGVTPYAQYTQLDIQTGAFSSPAETIYVDYWTGTAWSNLGTLTVNSLNTFTSNIWSSGYELRFRDGTTTGDTTQSTWQIDYVRLVAP